MAVGDIYEANNGGATTTTYTMSGKGNWVDFADWDTEQRNDNSLFTMASSTSLSASGGGGRNWLVVYTVRVDGFTNRQTMRARLLNDNGSGFVAVSGSMAGNYARNSANDTILMQGAGLILNQALDVKLQLEGEGPDSSGTLGGNGCRLWAIELPSDGTSEYLLAESPTSAAFNGQTWAEMSGWSANRETDTSVVRVNPTDDAAIQLRESGRTYLIHYAVAMDQTANARSQKIGRALIDGSLLEGGGSYGYFRGTSNGLGVLRRTILYRTTSADQDLTLEFQRGTADVDATVAHRRFGV